MIRLGAGEWLFLFYFLFLFLDKSLQNIWRGQFSISSVHIAGIQVLEGQSSLEETGRSDPHTESKFTVKGVPGHYSNRGVGVTLGLYGKVNVLLILFP